MSKKEKISNYELVKAVHNDITPSFGNRFSTESQAYWNDAKVIISAENFKAGRNEIYEALINRIALTVVHRQTFNNVLSFFKTGSMELGDTLQEISTDVIKEQKFVPGEVNQFEVFENDVKAAYHKVNRESIYPTTIHDPRLRRAFITEYGLQELINEFISNITNSNTIDEFVLTKKLINSYYKNTEFPVQSTQTIEVPDILKSDRTKRDIEDFLEICKKTLWNMQFPSRKYTSSGIMTQGKPETLCILLNTDVIVINEINNLSAAFHPNYMNVNVPIVGLDYLDEDNDDIIGVMLDTKAIEIKDTLRDLELANNARGLYRNYFYHIWQLYSFSPFKNAVWIKRKKS